MSQYDPDTHRTDPTGTRIPVVERPRSETHVHARRYDAGLIAPPVSVARGGRFIVICLATAAFGFFGAFWTIARANDAACRQRDEIAGALITIINRSSKTLPQLVKAGSIDQATADAALKNNRASIKDLTFPPC